MFTVQKKIFSKKINALPIVLMFFLTITPLILEASEENTSREETIVVWGIEAKSGVDQHEAATISAIVTMEVTRVSGKRAISEQEIKKLIIGEEIKFSCDAEEASCLAEIGAALGAPEYITGIVSKIGVYWVFALQRINVRTVEVVARHENRIMGDINVLIRNINRAVKDLFKEEIKEKEKKSKEQDSNTKKKWNYRRQMWEDETAKDIE